MLALLVFNIFFEFVVKCLPYTHFQQICFCAEEPGIYQTIKEITDLMNHLKWPIVETIRLQTRYNLQSLAHYHPITPTVLHYSSKFDNGGMNSIPTLGTSTNNLTNSYSLVQPVSLAHYQPITPAASQDPASSTGQSDSGSHGSSSDADNGNNYNEDSSYHSSNDNGNNDNAHYNNDHQKSSSSNHTLIIIIVEATAVTMLAITEALIIVMRKMEAQLLSLRVIIENFGDNNHGYSHYHGSDNDNGDDAAFL